MNRFVAILLMFIIMFPMSPAIGLAEDLTEYENSVSIVEALGIMTGYPDGTFRPKENVTRAEFASVISKILNLSPDVSDGEVTPYYDVPASHWASPYVNIANSYGLMNGYGNGYFMPEENITVSEATKVMVVLAGYEYFAIASGGYPSGYFVQANNLGLLEGINSYGDAFITRGELAHMLCSVFETDMYSPVSYGEDVNLRKEEGVTVLSKYHDIYETEGVVTATEFTSVNGDAVEAGEPGEIELDGEKYRTDFAGASSYLGYNVKAYYREENGGKRTVLYMEPADNTVLTFSSDDFAGADGYKIDYYEKASRKRTIEIESNTNIILNNEFAGRAVNFNLDSFADINGSVTLISNDGNSKYDVIFIKDYFADVVEGVDVEGERIGFKFSTNGFSLEDASYVIYKGEEKIELSDLNVSDVLIISASKRFLNGEEDGVVEIKVSDKIVSGTVSGTGDDKITISSKEGNNEYTLSSVYVSEKGSLPSVGDNGIFYLDDYGKVVCSLQSGGGMQFGYLIAAKVGSGIESKVQLKLLTVAGEVKAVDVKDKIKMDGKSVTSEDLYNSLMNNVSGVSMIVRYTLNENEVLTAIDTPAKNVDNDPDELTIKNETTKMRFQDKSKMLTCATPQRYIINDTVKVFEIPGEDCDDDDYKVYGSAYFQAFEYYGGSESGKTMTFCNVDGAIPEAVFMIGGTSSASTQLGGILLSENPTGVIKKKSYAFDSEGTECIKLIVDSHNTDVELYITEETKFLFTNGTQVVSDTLPGSSSKLTIDDFNFGDIVMYDLGSKSKVKVLLRINDTDVSKLKEGEYQVTGISGYTEFIMGSVRDKNGTIMELDASTSPNLFINARDTVYVHLIDMKAQKITKAVLGDIWASEADDDADKVFVRIRFGSVKEIYIYR